MCVIRLLDPSLAPDTFCSRSVVEHAKKLGWAVEFQLSPDAAVFLKQDDVVRKACTKNLTEKSQHISLIFDSEFSE
jgi:hypothetical protein